MLVNSIHETKRELKKYIKEIDTVLDQMAKGNMNQTVGNDYRGVSAASLCPSWASFMASSSKGTS